MSKSTEIIFGIHAVRHALKQSPENVMELWLLDGKRKSKEFNDIIDTAMAATISIQYVSRDAIEKITGDTVHQGIAIKRRTAMQTIVDLESLFESIGDSVPLILVLDGVQDPHNLGACLRTANATGVNAVIIPRDRAVPVNATVRKIASGAAEHTPVITVTNLARTLEYLQQRGVWCFGLADDAKTQIFATDLTIPMALVLGAEGKGLRQNTQKHCDQLMYLPMHGEVESLNVSVATAVCLYETIRQRSIKLNVKS